MGGDAQAIALTGEKVLRATPVETFAEGKKNWRERSIGWIGPDSHPRKPRSLSGRV